MSSFILSLSCTKIERFHKEREAIPALIIIKFLDVLFSHNQFFVRLSFQRW
ncbi:hypothetical protein RchiOBHm_Chr5g0029621 [Rosa chinensis]|uniref:Uncharacterized protein n=1 Tax=Rosa chinensis TaxID=74649 RepID=A0A2P6Q9P5_ROSCH|nr:hypothetical protein RchiOBHm_Chr5g0029621 [Rosa chinensis]